MSKVRLRPNFDLTIKGLRRLLPEWAWEARRDGWRYEYVGILGDRIVEVRARVQMFDDEYSSHATWYVYERGKPADVFWRWCAQNRAGGDTCG